MRAKLSLARLILGAAVLASACAGGPKPSEPEPFALGFAPGGEQAQTGSGAGGAQAAIEVPKPKSELFGKTALLVIDVQTGIFPVHRQAAFLANLKSLIAKAEEAKVPVIYIYHSGDPLLPGSSGWFLHPGIKPPEGHEQVRKWVPNSFEGTELETLLDLRRVGRLVVSGLASNGCVTATIWGAKARGYDIVLAADAHSTTSDYSEGTLDRVNDNWREWGARVLPVTEIEFD